MEKMDRHKKFMTGKKNIAFYVNEATFEALNKKLEEDGISKQYMLETAIQRYLAGIDHYKK